MSIKKYDLTMFLIFLSILHILQYENKTFHSDKNGMTINQTLP